MHMTQCLGVKRERALHREKTLDQSIEAGSGCCHLGYHHTLLREMPGAHIPPYRVRHRAELSPPQIGGGHQYLIVVII